MEWLRNLACAAADDVFGIKPGVHEFEQVISLLEDDGRVVAYRCVKCGYCTYMPTGNHHPRCFPREHEWEPVKVFRWDDVALHDKLIEPQQCKLCGAQAMIGSELKRYGCSGLQRKEGYVQG
jgi:hypothetical protein